MAERSKSASKQQMRLFVDTLRFVQVNA